MSTNPREAYDRWLRRKPISLLLLLGFALVLGFQVFAWSLGAGVATAVGRGLVVAVATGLIGTLFLSVVESDLRARLGGPAPSIQATAPSSELVVLPTPWKAFYYLTVPAIVVGVSVAYMWSADSLLGWSFVIFSLLFTVVFIAGAWLFVHNSRLVLTDDSLMKTNWRGATSRVSRDAIVRVLRLAYDRSGVSAYRTWITRYWIFESSAGRALEIVNQAMWPLGDMEILVGRLGVPVDGSWNDVLKPNDVRRQVKGVVRWTTAHPWSVLIAAVILTFALIVLLIALLAPSS